MEGLGSTRFLGYESQDFRAGAIVSRTLSIEIEHISERLENIFPSEDINDCSHQSPISTKVCLCSKKCVNNGNAYSKVLAQNLIEINCSKYILR